MSTRRTCPPLVDSPNNSTRGDACAAAPSGSISSAKERQSTSLGPEFVVDASVKYTTLSAATAKERTSNVLCVSWVIFPFATLIEKTWVRWEFHLAVKHNFWLFCQV